MTRDGTAEGISTDHGAAPALPTASLLNACDSVLREPGRRQHRFSWLRAPDAPPDGWLVVDAYYPAGRLVAVIGAPDAPEQALCRELVPPRGLRLLVLDPSRLPDDRAELDQELRRLIDELGPAPERAYETPLPGERAEGPSIADLAVGRVVAAFSSEEPPEPPPPRRVGPSHGAATERGARFVAAHKDRFQRPAGGRLRPPGAPQMPATAGRAPAPARPLPARPPASVAAVTGRRSGARALELVLGLVGLVVVLGEVYLAVGRIALEGGSVLLGFGLALDACARALGAVAASRSGHDSWAWWCVLGGSPAVAAFALYRSEGPVRVDPGPLAGLISLLAMALIVVSLAGAVLGI
jgi:hypothetical protein